MTSWMVAAIGALGALSGAWGGQWIAAKREDRRWERELAREDLRWQRDREREEDLRAHTVTQQWQDRRVDTYVEFFTALEKWQRLTRAADNARNDSPLTPELIEESTQVWEHCQNVNTRIELIGSPAIADLAHSAYCSVYFWWADVMDKSLAAPLRDDYDDRYAEAYGKLADGIRSELGLESMDIESQAKADHSRITLR